MVKIPKFLIFISLFVLISGSILLGQVFSINSTKVNPVIIPQEIEIEAETPSLDVPEVFTFIRETLAEAIDLYGEPRVPVKKVYLRLDSRPSTTLNDSENGIFTIAMTRNPDSYWFYGTLGHEVAHLLNARLFDCYVEGLNTVFGERAILRRGLAWSSWLKYFRDGGEPFYGTTYFMIDALIATIGQENMRHFFDFAVYQNSEQFWMSIDLNGWLNSLPEPVQTEAKNIILQHVTGVRSTLHLVDPRYTCAVPTL